MKTAMTIITLLISACPMIGKAATFEIGSNLAPLAAEHDKVMANEKDVDYDKANQFLYYVLGVSDALNSILFCLPSTATQGQVASVVSKYLRNNPESWSNPGSWVVGTALMNAFPCPAQQNK